MNNFKLIYLPSHDRYASFEARGFTSVKMAAIYAYHHLSCSFCKKERTAYNRSWEEAKKHLNINSVDEMELEYYKNSFDFHQIADLEDKWFACSCSSEWSIVEEV